MPGVKGRSGGRNRKTSQEHALNRSFRADRHAGVKNAAPPIGKPTPPRPLGPVAQAEWDRMVTRLETSKTNAIVDDAILFQYVQLFAEVDETATDREHVQQLSAALMKRALEKISGSELVEAIAKIVTLEYLLVKQKTQLRQGHIALKQMLVEFGMTPASRNRVRITGEDEEKAKSPLEQLQSQSRVLRFGA